MKRTLCLLAFVAWFIPGMLSAQGAPKKEVEISSAVLKTAEWANFKYMENLDLAISGDQKALKALLDFSGTVDGTESLQHATTCIELIPLVSDDKMAQTILTLKPRLIAKLLDRFQLAQGRTKKVDLRKPLQEWAPNTWKALHGERVDCINCLRAGFMTNEELKAMGDQKSGATIKPVLINDTDSLKQ